MRALCGSIIMAGALIGLGMTALGFGIRFQAIHDRHPEGTFQGALFGAPTLNLILVALLIALFIGLGIAFVGLAFHHERRYRETLHLRGTDTTSPRVPA
jgi:hypothetical protein